VSEHDDKTFLKRFGLIIVGLAMFGLILIFLATEGNKRIAGSENPMRDVARQDRLAPVFDVYSGETGRAAALAAAEQTREDSAPEAAFGGSLDGEMIYNNACNACHMAGAAGAPQLEAAQWEDRLDKGVDGLVSNAINGIGAMPPKGGRADLTDEQIRASVEYMVEQVQ